MIGGAEPAGRAEAAPGGAVGRCLALLGPPLSGKSTLARQLVSDGVGAAVFSVRSHFEPQRARGADLPPSGALLPDDVVVDAARPLLWREAGGLPVLDGFPGTAGQADLVVAELSAAGARLEVRWLPVERSVAAARARRRRVCVACDGGVDEAEPSPADDDACGRCGSALGRRPDDDAEGFARRWAGWRERAPAIAERLASHGVAIRPADAATGAAASAEPERFELSRVLPPHGHSKTAP